VTLRAISRLALLTLLPLAAGCSGSTLTAPTPVASPVTETFSSLLSVGGTATRSVTMPEHGSLKVRLAATTPASVVLGLGLGIPQKTGRGCTLTTTVTTAAGAGPQVSLTADPGEYCVEIYDPGALSAQASFTITIEHP
jgi:hypothetical protein